MPVERDMPFVGACLCAHMTDKVQIHDNDHLLQTLAF